MKKRMSGILAVLMSLLVLISSIIPAYADTLNPTITIDSKQAVKGSNVSTKLTVSNNPGIAAATFKIVYDGSVLKLNSVDFNTGFGGDFDELGSLALPVTDSDTLKAVQISWSSMSNIAQNGTFLTMNFTVSSDAKKDSSADITVISNSGDFCDIDENDVDFSTVSGTIKIVEGIPGDINRDKVVNSKDLIRLRKYFTGWDVDVDILACDCNGDGNVNSKDLIRLRKYFSGWDVELFYGPNNTVACRHNLTKIAAKAATCTENGNDEYWYCTECGKYYTDSNASNQITIEDTIIKASHNEIVKEAIPATPTSEGYTEGIWCDKCNTWLSGHERIDPIKPNTKSIKYNVVDEAKHPYLKTLQIDTSTLDFSYTPGKKTVLRNLDLGKYGYTFDGWYDSFAENATRIKEISETANENIELFAHVSEAPYDITYNTYQTPVSSSPKEEQLHYTVSKGNSNLYTPDINNYKFLGWYDNNGVEYKTIPIGSTGDITLNAYYTSLRNLAVSKEDNNPIILEDQNANVVYFTYEIGEIKNIPLNGDNPFWEIQSVAGLSQQVSKTYNTAITSSEAASISKTISDMTSNSSTWTLSESWNNVTTVNETWAKTIKKDVEQCKTEATTSSNTLSVSAQNGGSSYHKSEDGSTVYDYNSKTTTKDKGHQFDASLKGTYTNKMEANLGASTEYGATDSYGYTNKSKNNEYNHTASGSDKDVLSSGIKYENGVEASAGLSYGYHNNTTTVTKTGTDKVTTNSKIDENTSSWNASSAFSSTQQHSSSQSVRNALSDIVTTTKGYGNTYSKGGTDSSTQGFSSTSSDTTGTTSSVTYSKLKSETTTTTYSVDGKIEGKYRCILVGKAHVFAVVGYDYSTKSFFTYTFSVMDDKVEEFLDYTPKGGAFDDCEYSCLPFEVPYYVFEYVSGKTSKTTGIQYITDSLNGTAKITGYSIPSDGSDKKEGSDKKQVYDVIIPSYVSDGKQAYKVTEVSAKAFAGKPVRSVVLGEFIETIPDGAFENCTELEEVIGSFTEIGNAAFAGCTKLTNMNIPSNVVKVGVDAFKGANSINVRIINSLTSYAEAINLLPNGKNEQINEKQKEITQDFIESILKCGAKNIVIDLSYIVNDTPLSLVVPAIESIEINGGLKTYEEFYIDSSAKKTSLSEMTINSKHGTPMKVDSDKLTLHKVFVSGNTTTLILKKDGAVLSLIQDSSIKTSADYAVIGKNPVIESQVTADGAAGHLNVTKNFGYVNSIDGDDYINITDGKLIKISEDEFEKYISGQCAVTFDANEGQLDSSEITKTVFYGEKFGALPTPTREYYNFSGWFTEKNDGKRVTEETEVNSTEDIILYAHWEQKPTSGWVLASELPANAKAVEEKWTYDETTKITSDKSEVEGYTLYDTTSEWSEYGEWSAWSFNAVSASESRQVEKKSVHTGYYMDTYNTMSTGGARQFRSFSIDGKFSSYGCSSSYGEYHKSTTMTLSEANSVPKVAEGAYASNCSFPGYNKGNGTGYILTWQDGGTYVFFISGNVYNPNYRYRDRKLVYTYWLSKTEAKESTSEVEVSESISNVQKWVKYIEK